MKLNLNRRRIDIERKLKFWLQEKGKPFSPDSKLDKRFDLKDTVIYKFDNYSLKGFKRQKEFENNEKFINQTKGKYPILDYEIIPIGVLSNLGFIFSEFCEQDLFEKLVEGHKTKDGSKYSKQN